MTTHDGYTFGAALAADPPNPIIVDGYAPLIHEPSPFPTIHHVARPAFVPEVPPGWYEQNAGGGDETEMEWATSREIDAMEIAAEAFRARVYVMLDMLREIGGFLSLHPMPGRIMTAEIERAIPIVAAWAKERGIDGIVEAVDEHCWVKYRLPAGGNVVIHRPPIDHPSVER